MSEGLSRALAAAELACKSAKKRGRNHLERYAIEDSCMVRRHADVQAVGLLRAVFKFERLMLYARGIMPVCGRSLPDAYEILLSVREADRGVISPGPWVNAAERYPLLPSVDRRVAHLTVQKLAHHRDT